MEFNYIYFPLALKLVKLPGPKNKHAMSYKISKLIGQIGEDNFMANSI